MNEREIADALKKMKVLPSENLDIAALAARWGRSSDSLVRAALSMLGELNKLDGVKLAQRNNGVSGYGHAPGGRRRECFHIRVNVMKARMIIYQHGQANDPEGFFNRHQRGNERVRYGYLSEGEGELDKIPYVTTVLQESYKNITGR